MRRRSPITYILQHLLCTGERREHLALAFSSSRAAIWKQIGGGNRLVEEIAQVPKAAAAPLGIAIASLSGLTCALVTPLLGGHTITLTRGKSKARIGSVDANTPGTLVGAGAKFCIPKALEALAVVIKCTIGRYANLACILEGDDKLYALPWLARAVIQGVGDDSPRAIFTLDEFFGICSSVLEQPIPIADAPRFGSARGDR